VHLVGFTCIIRIYHDAQSSECQIFLADFNLCTSYKNTYRKIKLH